MGGMSLVGALFGGAGQKTPDPPKPEIPAVAAPNSRTPGATVRVGAENDKVTEKGTSAEMVGFAETRKQGKALGGLGRGGLVI